MKKTVYILILLCFFVNGFSQIKKATCIEDLKDYEREMVSDSLFFDDYHIINDARAWENLETANVPLLININEFGIDYDGNVVLNANVVNCSDMNIVGIEFQGTFNNGRFTKYFSCNILHRPNDTYDSIRCYGDLIDPRCSSQEKYVTYNINLLTIYYEDKSHIHITEDSVSDILVWESEAEWKSDEFNPLSPIF